MSTSRPKPKTSRPLDPGYDYAFLPDERNRNRVGCKFCQLVFYGGITRLKEHIAGKKGNAQSCDKAPEDAKQKCATLLAEKQKQKETKVQALNALRSQVHLTHSDGEQSPDETVQNPSSKGSGTGSVGPIDKFCKVSTEEVARLKKGKQVQPAINHKLKEEKRQRACEYIGQWFYEAAIPHNAVKLPSFELMVEAIGDYGRCLRCPTPYELSGPILQKQKKKVEDSLKLHRESWAITGCSIMTDGWTDKKGRGIMNLVVHCAHGACFLRSIDASADKKNGQYIFELVDSCIEEVGEKNVVQVVSDNARPNETAAELLKMKRPNIFWTACAAHCIDLMLEDIGGLLKVKNIIEKAKAVTVFLYAHQRGLEFMRRFLGKDLVRSGITRFATAYLNLKSLDEKKTELKSLFRSQEFEAMGYLTKKKGHNAFNVVVSDDFWRGVSYAIKVFEPLVEVLRLVDSDTPAMGLFWGALEDAKKTIALNFDGNEKHYKQVWDIIDRRWDAKLKTPLHKAGHYLNPYYYFENRVDITTNGDFRGGVIACSGKMCNEDEQDQVAFQLDAYERGTGSFGSAMAVRQRKKKGDPAIWWSNHGNDTPHLRKLAIRILSLTCSSSACERNWSTFEQVHSKKRARMLHTRLNDLVFVKFNSKLQQKRENKERDPIEAQNVDVLEDENNEWVGNVPSDGEEYAVENEENAPENLSTRNDRELVGPSARKRSRLSGPSSSKQVKKMKRIMNTGDLVSSSSSEDGEELNLPSSEDDEEELEVSSSSGNDE